MVLISKGCVIDGFNICRYIILHGENKTKSREEVKNSNEKQESKKHKRKIANLRFNFFSLFFPPKNYKISTTDKRPKVTQISILTISFVYNKI